MHGNGTRVPGSSTLVVVRATTVRPLSRQDNGICLDDGTDDRNTNDGGVRVEGI